MELFVQSKCEHIFFSSFLQSLLIFRDIFDKTSRKEGRIYGKQLFEFMNYKTELFYYYRNHSLFL